MRFLPFLLALLLAAPLFSQRDPLQTVKTDQIGGVDTGTKAPPPDWAKNLAGGLTGKGDTIRPDTSSVARRITTTQKVRAFNEGYFLIAGDTIQGRDFVGCDSLLWFLIINDGMLHVVGGDGKTDRVLYDQWRAITRQQITYNDDLALFQQPYAVEGGGLMVLNDYTTKDRREAYIQLSVSPAILLVLIRESAP